MIFLLTSLPTAFGGGAGSGSIFGQTSGTSTAFGQPATSTAGGLFGGASSGGSLFGGGQQGLVGTTIKFQAASGSDTMVKNNVSTTVNTRHQVITAMKEYEGKSFEVSDFTWLLMMIHVQGKLNDLKEYTSRFLLTGYVDVVLLRLLQLGVPLRVRYSYCMHGTPVTVAAAYLQSILNGTPNYG